jgi:uncharacterized protein with GYD domain
MIFVTLVRFKKKPTKADQAETDRVFAQQEQMGIRTICSYWTFGRYDAIRVFEAPDEKTVLKALARAPDAVQTETLIAVDREDVKKLLE